MSQTKITPINEEHLEEIGRFLHENLNRHFSPERWIQSLTHPWAQSRPNFGMQLRNEGMLVGVFCAIYSDQVIDGRVERFCNPHSWCVLDAYRRHSIGLVLQIIKQGGYHFTMFTPNPKVTEVFRGLKFKDLDARQFVMPNFPSLHAWRKGSFVESRPGRIGSRLNEHAKAEYEAHRDIPWLNFVAFGAQSDACLAIFKSARWKRMPSAWIMHVSDPRAFIRHGHLLRSHLLLRRGILTSRIEARWLQEAPSIYLKARRTQPKLFLSATLDQAEIRDVYSELMALDV